MMRAVLALAVSLAAFSASAENAKPFRVMMILFRGCEEACEGFRDYFARQRVPVEFLLRDAAQDKKRVAEFVAEAKRDRPDLVVTWGTSVTLEAVGKWGEVDPKRHIVDIPVVFMIVSQPAELGIVPSLASSKRNVTGSLYLLPVEEQLRAARAYFDFRRVGFLDNPAEANSRASLQALRTLAPRFGLTLVEETLDLDGAGKPRADSLAAKVDALAAAKVDVIYQAPDSFLNVQRDVVTGTALRHGIPVFAAAEAPVVKSDALLGVVNRYDHVGRFTARQALRILKDRVRPADIPIELPRQFSYLVNLRIAHQLHRYPPLPLLDVAEIVGNECPEEKKCD